MTKITKADLLKSEEAVEIKTLEENVVKEEAEEKIVKEKVVKEVVEEKKNPNTSDGLPPRYVCGNLQPVNAK